MSALPASQHISIADYLAGELESPVKHEYLRGVVHAMAGARNRHHEVATNLLVSVGFRLRGKPCRPCNSDTKVGIQLPTQTRFDYPDAMIVCNPNLPDETIHDRPVVVVEVLSDATRRIDEGEKRDAYLTIPTLIFYLLIDPNRPLVIAYRRGEQGFTREVIEGGTQRCRSRRSASNSPWQSCTTPNQPLAA